MEFRIADTFTDSLARLSGSAGTGKTIVALHRAVYLARKHPESRVLLTTFSDPLANALQTKLQRLVGNEPRLGERVDVYALDAIGRRLYKAHCGPLAIADDATVAALVKEAAKAVDGHKFSLHFLRTEWEQVVDAWQLETWEAYRDVERHLLYVACTRARDNLIITSVKPASEFLDDISVN